MTWCVVLALVVGTISQAALAQAPKTPFQHPGLFNSRAELDFIKAKVAAKEEPWFAALTALQNSPTGKLDYKPNGGKPFDLNLPGVFRCPLVNPAQHCMPGFPISYVMNDQIHMNTGAFTSFSDWTWRNIAALTAPSRTFALTEQVTGYGYYTDVIMSWWGAIQGSDGNGRHGKYTDNFLFWDGHVRSYNDIYRDGTGCPTSGTDIQWSAQ